jgi:3-hydroxyisobutyrate dehydrogenase-like beta-hydroxyacid dehydrogenase
MPPHVKAAFEGESGILAGLDSGKIWIDHSTTDFEQTQIFNEQVKKTEFIETCSKLP